MKDVREEELTQFSEWVDMVGEGEWGVMVNEW